MVRLLNKCDSLTHFSRGNSIKAPMRHYPNNLRLSNAIDSGSSCHYDDSIFARAKGEFLERMHFYAEVKHDLIGHYSDLNKQEVVDSLGLLFSQIKNTDEDSQNSVFHLNHVENIINNESAYLPSIFFSMGNHYHDERRFAPFIDTCGQSAHVDPSSALDSALLEFIERQAMLAAWLTESYTEKIDIDNDVLLGVYSEMLNTLNNNGELICLNISGVFPIPVVMLLYFSKSQSDIVQYSVGAAASYTTREAFTKALLELWQTYQFVYFNSMDTLPSSARFFYLKRFLQFNNIHTKDLFHFNSDTKNTVSLSSYLARAESRREILLADLTAISTSIYQYRAEVGYDGANYYYSKIFSPDFYLHINTVYKFNHINKYSQKLNIVPHYLEKGCLPFP